MKKVLIKQMLYSIKKKHHNKQTKKTPNLRMFSQRLFFPWVAALSPATSYHSTVSLKALISKVEKLSRKSQSRMCGRGSVPCKQPSGRHPKPRVGSTGTPTGGSCHSLSFQLPFPAIIPCCSGSSTLDV